MNNFYELAHDRYSARKFKEGVVCDSDLNKIIEAGLCAPTAVNFQPVKLFVFKSEESRKELLSCTKMKFIEPAPVIIAVGSKSDQAWVRPFDNKNFGDVDASIVATHIMLQIHDLGYGSTWIGHFDQDKVKELFPDTKDYELIALLPVGIIADDCAPSERHCKQKNREELLEEF